MRRLRDPLPATGYQVVRNNDVWVDHQLRVLSTAAMIAWFKPGSIADPACGDASVVLAARRLNPISRILLNDISTPQYRDLLERFQQQTSSFVQERPNIVLGNDSAEVFLEHMPEVDLVVLTEILEHVEDPGQLVSLAAAKARFLVASSPIDESESVSNHEHVWSFSQESYEKLLRDGGWQPSAFEMIDPGSVYRFQVWGCERA